MVSEPAQLRVGDLVTVPAVRPVIRLVDLQDANLRHDLAAQFVPTDEARHALATVMEDVARGRGRGYFVEGSFGAGKSHLLSMVHLALVGEVCVAATTAQMPRVVVVPISLVEHAAVETLEDVVRAHLTLAGVAGSGGTRREVWSDVQRALAAGGWGGLVILLDELSEFLRSKSDSRMLSEDIRFLQFLGEWSERLPAWIVCSVQESIENAADIAPAVFRKIKDRYPVRFRLGGEHIKELVAQRLIRRRDGAEKPLAELYAQLTRAFGGLPFSHEDFLRLYPVHPATVDLIDELRGLFSQQRGAVDFIGARLAGDAARRIPGLLDQPADRFLCPDAIYDHFRDRIREQPETNRIATVVLAYFEREAGRLFPDPKTAAVAVRAVKLLALGALCPAPRSWTVEEVTGRLLYRLTDLDPGANQDLIGEILARLAAEGTFVVRVTDRVRGGEGYRIDLKAQFGLALRRRLEYVRGSLLPDDGRMFHLLARSCADPLVPLDQLLATPRAVREVRWLNSPRLVAVWSVRLSEMEEGGARELAQTLASTEADVGIFYGQAYPAEAHAARARWDRVLRPTLATAAGREPLLAWIPRDPSEGELSELREALAAVLLGDELAADHSAVGEGLLRHLEDSLPAHRRRVTEIYRSCYLEGVVLDTRGDVAAPGALAGSSLDNVLGQLVAAKLQSRFPRYAQVAPRAEYVNLSTIGRVLQRLAAEPEVRVDDDPAVRTAVEQMLLPLGLVQRQARGYRLTADVRGGELAGGLLAAVEGATPACPARLESLYWRLRKGPFGLPRRVFEVLLLTLCHAGSLIGCRAGRRLPVAQVGGEALWELDGVVAGELLAPGLQDLMASLPMLPARLRRGPVTQVLQREAWEALVAWSRDWGVALADLERQLDTVRGFPLLRPLWDGGAVADVGRVVSLVRSVHTSYGPREGIEYFLAAWQARPSAAEALARVERLRRFFTERLERFLFTAGYLTSEDLALRAELTAMHAGLITLLRDPEAIISDLGWQRLQEGFAQLHQAYVDAYMVAHADAVGEAALAPYEALRRTAGYAVVEILGAVPGMEPVGGAKDGRALALLDRVALDRCLNAALAMRCLRPDAEIRAALARLPVCPCGFRVGCELSRETVERLQQAIPQTARAYLAAIRQPKWSERLRSHMEGLRGVGRAREARAVAELLTLDPEAAGALASAAALFATGEGLEVVAALSGRALIVDRDLAQLESTLAGRTFEPRQLVAAVEDWLGSVPTGTYVRVEGDAGVRSPGLTPTASTPTELPGVRVATLNVGGETETSAAAAAAVREVRALDAQALSAAEALASTAAQPPVSHNEWARAFAAFCHLERLLAEAGDRRRLAGILGICPRSALPVGWQDAQRAVRQSFRRFYASAGAGGDTLGRLYADWARRWADTGPALALPGAFFWCIDALRADLVPALLTELGGAAKRLDGGWLWALAPTVTRIQFAALRTAGFAGPVLPWGDEEIDALLASPATLREVDWTAGEPCIWRWTFLDAKVHTAQDDLAALLAEFRTQVRRRLAPTFRALPKGAMTLICGDHGFVENPAFRRKDEHSVPRYLHGGPSPEEVLTPWVLLRRE